MTIYDVMLALMTSFWLMAMALAVVATVVTWFIESIR